MNDTEVESTVRRLLVSLLEDIDMVQIDVEQGVVYLEGVAKTLAQKQRIEGSVQHLPGVRRVINCLSLEHVAALGGAVEWPAFIPTPTYKAWQPPRVGGFGTS